MFAALPAALVPAPFSLLLIGALTTQIGTLQIAPVAVAVLTAYLAISGIGRAHVRWPAGRAAAAGDSHRLTALRRGAYTGSDGFPRHRAAGLARGACGGGRGADPPSWRGAAVRTQLDGRGATPRVAATRPGRGDRTC